MALGDDVRSSFGTQRALSPAEPARSVCQSRHVPAREVLPLRVPQRPIPPPP